MKRLLPKLTERLAPIQPLASKIPVPKFSLPLPEDPTPLITHDWLWPRVGQFLQKKDVVVAETGTSSFGVLDVPFPDDAVFVSQILWGSIGWTVGEQLTTCLHRHLLMLPWTTGSTLGAALAARDIGLNRTILFVGDGSLYASNHFSLFCSALTSRQSNTDS